MSSEMGLDGAAVKLLLELLELPEPVLSGAGAQMEFAASSRLGIAGLLVPYDHEVSTASLSDDDDVPTSLIWSEQLRSQTYFNPIIGQVAVREDLLLRRRLETPAVLMAMTAALDVPGTDKPFELIDGFLWEIGNIRLQRRRDRVPIWFARRIWSPSVHRQVADMASARPHVRQRVVLTSSPPARARGVEIPGHIIVPVCDVLAKPGDLAVDPEILDALLGGGGTAHKAGPLELSKDGTRLTINGVVEIRFRSVPQIAAIRSLVEAYRAGRRVPVSDLTHLGSLRRLFGEKRWIQLSSYLKSNGDGWGFEL